MASTGPTITAPTALAPSHSPSSTSTSAGACPKNPSICTCSTPADKAFTQPIIGCANKKCRPRYYHLRCVGLFHHPANQFTWLCPTCAPDAPLPSRICDCEDPPYRTGPMVECAQQELCKTRMYHLPCTGLCPGEDTTGWTCAECSVAIVMRQDREEELERRRANGEVVEEEEEEVVVQEQPPVPAEAADDEEEAEQREYVSDGVPGVFLGEEDEPRPASASPLKRKSSEPDTPPARKKTKRATPSPPPPLSPSPEPEPEYCVCGTPATDDMVACDAPNCHAEWFHFECVGLRAETVPEGEWFCEECEEAMAEAKKNKKKKKGGKGKGKGKGRGRK